MVRHQVPVPGERDRLLGAALGRVDHPVRPRVLADQVPAQFQRRAARVDPGAVLGQPVQQPVPLRVGPLGQQAEIDVDVLGRAHQAAQTRRAQRGIGVPVRGRLLDVRDEPGVRGDGPCGHVRRGGRRGCPRPGPGCRRSARSPPGRSPGPARPAPRPPPAARRPGAAAGPARAPPPARSRGRSRPGPSRRDAPAGCAGAVPGRRRRPGPAARTRPGGTRRAGRRAGRPRPRPPPAGPGRPGPRRATGPGSGRRTRGARCTRAPRRRRDHRPPGPGGKVIHDPDATGPGGPADGGAGSSQTLAGLALRRPSPRPR